MCDFLGKTKIEILDLGRSVEKNKNIKIGDFEFKVRFVGRKVKAKTYYKKVDVKKSGGRNKLIDITSVVKDKGCLTHKRKYYMDGKLTNKKEIAAELGISLTYLTTRLARVKRITIDGYNILIKSDEPFYTPVKDGKKYKRANSRDCAELAKLDPSTIKELFENKNYSRKEGWRFL
jgi:hypothetical protein